MHCFKLSCYQRAVVLLKAMVEDASWLFPTGFAFKLQWLSDKKPKDNLLHTLSDNDSQGLECKTLSSNLPLFIMQQKVFKFVLF